MLAELLEHALVLENAMAERRDTTGPADEITRRILDAALAQFIDFGLRRTTMEDVARRSGLARATVYRRFSGKEELTQAVVLREVQRFLAGLAQARGRAATSEERVVETTVYALRTLRGHDLLKRLIHTEPEQAMRLFTVDGDPILRAARTVCARVLREEIYGSGPVPPEAARDIDALAEIGVRLIISFLLDDRGVIALGTADEAREFGRRYIAPVYTSLLNQARR